MLVTESILHEWARSLPRDAQEVVVELVWRLVCASISRPKDRRFPLGDSIGQHWYDGYLDTDFDYQPFIPQGISFWEIGTGIDPHTKATSDYTKVINDPELTAEEKKASTFIFVTPMSGVIWSGDEQAKWLKKRRDQNIWKDVRILDATKLIDWIRKFPAVEIWLASKISNRNLDNVEIVSERWETLQSIGSPPPLKCNVFCIGRNQAAQKLDEIISNTQAQLQVDCKYPEQVADFVAAYFSSLSKELKEEVVGKTLIITSPDAWKSLVALQEPHILVADFDMLDAEGTKLLENAKRRKHSVIYRGQTGGLPHGNRIELKNPKVQELQATLEESGHSQERARILSQKSSGNLNTLIRVLSNLAASPSWAQDSETANLAIAQLFGSWNEENSNDQDVIGFVAGKPYGEWVKGVNKLLTNTRAPLVHYSGRWKVVGKYESWEVLAPKIFETDLKNVIEVALKVLGEIDLKYTLPQEERLYADLKVAKLKYSHLLKSGLSESLAIIGSLPEAATNIDKTKTTNLIDRAISDLLLNKKWEHWASIKEYLPYLAEASPESFLSSVENTLETDKSVFESLMKEEGNGILGSSLVAGLLWALETLAWESKYLARTASILFKLSSIDPGGQWSNRPIRSLSSIFMPWLTQTCASFEKRKIVLESNLSKYPEITWTVLIDLLPSNHQVMSGSRRPSWREIIPVDFDNSVNEDEYWQQVEFYIEKLIFLAKQDTKKMVGLIDKFDDLPNDIVEKLLVVVRENVKALPDEMKVDIWEEFLLLITKHKKFHDADWAMTQEMVNKIESLANSITPTDKYLTIRRYFSDKEFVLFDERSNFDTQHRKLEELRQKSLNLLISKDGLEKPLRLITEVESSYKLGFSLGQIGMHDNEILPFYFSNQDAIYKRFVGGYIFGRFLIKGYDWVDGIDDSQWSNEEIANFYSYLPFEENAWKRVESKLKSDEGVFWTNSNVNPYSGDGNIIYAVKKLITYKRFEAAISCLEAMNHSDKDIPEELIIESLNGLVQNNRPPERLNSYGICELIKYLQESKRTDIEDKLYAIEFQYIELLRHGSHVKPKTLGKRLSKDPYFFVEALSYVYKSDKPEEKKNLDEDKDKLKNLVTQCYRLLDSWKIPPGVLEDKSFDEKLFENWVNTALAEAEKVGRLTVAQLVIGKVLIYSPADPSGLWIHKKIADFVELSSNEPVRNSINTAFFNSRGVHWVDPEGKGDLELSKVYFKKAEELENAGYIKFSNSLSELAKSYVASAERIKNSNIFEDE